MKLPDRGTHYSDNDKRMKVMKRYILSVAVMMMTIIAIAQNTKNGQSGKKHQTICIDAAKAGLIPDNKEINAAAIMQHICDSLRLLSEDGNNRSIVLSLKAGKYYFHPEGAAQRTYFISNHDQPNPKKVGMALENLQNVTIDGNGAEFIFFGQMLPVSLVNSTDCTLRNFSIDFDTPHIAQAEVVANNDEGIKFRMSIEDKWQVHEGALWTHGEGWQYHADYAIAFDGETRHLLPQTSDLRVKTRNLTITEDSLLWAKDWHDERIKIGTRLAMRTWNRPAPGIFMADDVRTLLENINIHYAEGMGLLAQMCEDITADRLSVCLRSKDDHRYFTTQADATHFSGCKGTIIERRGLFEGMMDDAINVHGTYLKIMKRIDGHTFIGQYMHEQSYGFRWGEVGDTVQFISSQTMEKVGGKATISSIIPIDANINEGVTQFRITFSETVAAEVNPEVTSFGMENLTWTPQVIFEQNTIRNNRARGSLFSTPRKVIVRKNTFDHTSGCAILLCGDCNGWYETGACQDVLIEKNKFINALTNEFQFTNAIISIYPEIPDLEHQKQYFHSNIRIEANHFDTFAPALLYAKSVDGLTFKRNSIKHNNDFTPYHWNTQPFLLEHVINFKKTKNKYY